MILFRRPGHSRTTRHPPESRFVWRRLQRSHPIGCSGFWEADMNFIYKHGAIRLSSRFPRNVLLLMVLISLGVHAGWPQSDVSGFWVFRAPTGDGNFRETFFELKQNG